MPYVLCMVTSVLLSVSSCLILSDMVVSSSFPSEQLLLKVHENHACLVNVPSRVISPLLRVLRLFVLRGSFDSFGMYCVPYIHLYSHDFCSIYRLFRDYQISFSAFDYKGDYVICTHDSGSCICFPSSVECVCFVNTVSSIFAEGTLCADDNRFCYLSRSLFFRGDVETIQRFLDNYSRIISV